MGGPRAVIGLSFSEESGLCLGLPESEESGLLARGPPRHEGGPRAVMGLSESVPSGFSLSGMYLPRLVSLGLKPDPLPAACTAPLCSGGTDADHISISVSVSDISISI